MRNLFIVLAKLAGFIQLYWILLDVLKFVITLLAVLDGGVQSGVGGRALAGLGIYIALTSAFTWLLLIKPRWLAQMLRIPEDGSFDSLDSRLWLSVGIKLIGVYVTVYGLIAFVSVLTNQSTAMDPATGEAFFDITPFAIKALQLGLGLFLMFKSDLLVKWMGKKTA